MSRYEIPAPEGREIAVGWDPPMETFFAHLYDTTVGDDEDDLIGWVGQTLGEVKSLDALVGQVEAWGAKVDLDTTRLLKADSEVPWEPSPFQTFLREEGIIK